MNNLINIGFGNLVNADKIISIVSPDAAPVKRLVQHGRDADRVVDATAGRKTKAVIVCESDRIILSALGADTIWKRAAGKQSADVPASEE